MKATVTEKTKQLTLQQRQKRTVGSEDKSSESKVAENQQDIVENEILKPSAFLNPGLLKTVDTSLKKSKPLV